LSNASSTASIPATTYDTRYNHPTKLPPDHLLLDSVPNLGPLISRWEINKFENC
jgi:hypothetical protein